MDVILFLMFAVIAVVCAINVVVQTHPISSALSLVGVMGSLAVLYLLLGAEFIAAAQVIVYAGAIMVLFVFVIMLLNLRHDIDDGLTHTARRVLGWFFALVLACGLVAADTADTRADEPYTPAPADKVPNYFAQPMPCKIKRDMRAEVVCDGQLLESKSLRELSILRNTIYARYGWDGYRKPWLRAYFHGKRSRAGQAQARS